MAANDAPVTVTIRADSKDLKTGFQQAIRASEAEIRKLKKGIDSLRSTAPTEGAQRIKQMQAAAQAAERQVLQLKNSLRGLSTAAPKGGGGLAGLLGGGAFGGAFAGGLIGGGVAGLVQAIPQAVAAFTALLDENTKIQNSLKLTGIEGEKLTAVYDQLADSAQKNGANLDALARLYSRVAQSQDELGISSEQVVHFVDGISTAIRVAGTGTEEARGALLQLSQALGAGAVRGDEFNSIMEGLLPVMQTVAAGLGVSVGSLKKMAAEGKLTAKVFLDAFTAGQAGLEARAGRTALTIGQAWENVHTATLRLVKVFDELTGASGKIASIVELIGNSIAGVGAAFDVVSTAVEKLNTALDELGKKVGIENLSAIIGTILKPLIDPVSLIGDVNKVIDAQTAEVNKLRAAYDRFVSAGGWATELSRRWNDVGEEVNRVKGDVAELQVEISKTEAAKAVELGAAYASLQDKIAKNIATAEDFNRVIKLYADTGTRAGKEIADSLADARDMLDKTSGVTKEATKATSELADAIIEAFGPQAATLIDTLGSKLGNIVNILALMTGNAGAFFQMMQNGITSMSAGAGQVTDDVRELIKGYESFSPKAYWDVNHWRVGFGSDTFVDEMGNIKEVTKDTVVTLDQATKDLDRRIGEFQSTIVSKIGPDMWNSLNKGQKAALTSIVYNYGELPNRVANAIKTGNTGDVQRAIAGLGADNAGMNKKRRESEAALYGKESAYGSAATSVGELTDAQKKENETEQKRLEMSGALTDAFDEETYKKVRAAEITKNMAAAEEDAANRRVALSQEERDEIIKNAEAKAKLAAQEAGTQKAQDAAKSASESYAGQLKSLTDLNAQYEQQAQQLGTTTAALEANLDATARKKALDEAANDVLKIKQGLEENGVRLTQAQTDALTAQAESASLAKAGLDQYGDTTKKVAAAQEQFAQQAAQLASSALSGFISDLRAGKSAGEAFANMLGKITDQLIDMALNMVFKNMFAGIGGGGIGIPGLAKGGIAGRDGEPTFVPAAGRLKYRYPRHFASGGWASGIPAMLHPGELVVPRSVVASAGRGAGRPVGGDVTNNVGDVNVDMGSTGLVAATTEKGRLLGRQIQTAVEVILVRESRPGGILRKQGTM